MTMIIIMIMTMIKKTKVSNNSLKKVIVESKDLLEKIIEMIKIHISR